MRFGKLREIGNGLSQRALCRVQIAILDRDEALIVEGPSIMAEGTGGPDHKTQDYQKRSHAHPVTELS